MDFANETSLRRTFAPYTGQTVILSLVTIYIFVISLKTSFWTLFFIMPVGWTFYGMFVAIALRYRISYGTDYIRRRASGGPDVVISVRDVTSIAKERANAAEMVAQSKPFRRIRISDRSGQSIDVSLKHFRSEDINALLHWLHRSRPDLAMPKDVH